MEFDRLVVSFLVDEVVGGFFISVPPGHIACVYDRGRGVLNRVWGPGLHLKIPFWQVAKLFNAQVLEYSLRRGYDFTKNKEALGDDQIRTATKDGEDVTVEGSILFRIDKQNAPELWENVGENVVSKLVRPFARSRIATIFSQLELNEIKARRADVENLVRQDLNEQFKDRGLVCEGFLLSEVLKYTDHGKVEPVVQVPDHMNNYPGMMMGNMGMQQYPGQQPQPMSAPQTPQPGVEHTVHGH